MSPQSQCDVIRRCPGLDEGLRLGRIGVPVRSGDSVLSICPRQTRRPSSLEVPTPAPWFPTPRPQHREGHFPATQSGVHYESRQADCQRSAQKEL